MLNIGVLLYVLDMLNICMSLCVLIIVCAARCTQYLCCFMCLLLYVPLDMLDIFSAPLAYAPTIYVALELGKIGHSDVA